MEEKEQKEEREEKAARGSGCRTESIQNSTTNNVDTSIGTENKMKERLNTVVTKNTIDIDTGLDITEEIEEAITKERKKKSIKRGIQRHQQWY